MALCFGYAYGYYRYYRSGYFACPYPICQLGAFPDRNTYRGGPFWAAAVFFSRGGTERWNEKGWN